MNKATLTWLTSTGSLAALLLMSNSANAIPVEALTINPVVSAPTSRLVNLNQANPMLNLTEPHSNPILDQLGCSCATCTKTQNQM